MNGLCGTRRFTTPTEGVAAARSTVDALTFRALTRALLSDHTWQANTKAVLLLSSEAFADRYDGGGMFGGTLERPVLRQLLADIERGLIDVAPFQWRVFGLAG